MSRTKVSFDEKAIDSIFRDLNQSHLPGAAVGMAIGGVPVYRKGFGLASTEGIAALTPQTRMRVYSITKHFTCLAYLLLCEQGKAGIDDPVGKYLSGLHPVTRDVTLRQLMSHTSGIRDACDIRWFFSGIQVAVDRRDLLAMYREISDVNFRPGESWCYNNGAYHILSAVIETLADQPLEAVFRRRIFEPLGMHDTFLRRVDTDFVAGSAAMHTLGPDGKFEKSFLPGELAGEGGIVSTVDDMLRWMRNIAHPVVGTPESWRLISTSQRLNDGAETGYGLGLLVRSYRGVAALAHSGGGLGSNSQMIRLPELDLDVIVSVNRSDSSSLELAGSILDTCLGLDSEPSRPAGRYPSGLFRSPMTGRTIRLYGRGELHVACIDGGEDIRVLATGHQQLGPSSHRDAMFAITWGEYGAEPERIRYEFFGSRDELITVPLEPLPAPEVLRGDYEADGIGARISFVATAEGICPFTSGRFGSRGYDLEGLGCGMWRIRSRRDALWSATVALQKRNDFLLLSTPNTWQVPFRRLP